MTAQEFKTEFLIEYDKVASLAAPGYEDYEISIFLTRAQERLVKRHYEAKSNRLGQGFDGSEKRRKDLSELISDGRDSSGVDQVTSSTNQNTTVPNGKMYDLPDDVLYVLSEAAYTDIKDCNNNNTLIKVKPITYDEYMLNVNNPFKKPSKELVWRLDFSKVSPNIGKKRHELVTDGSFNILNYRMRYIRKPKPIIVSNITPKTIEGFSSPMECELDSSLHREIVSEAVSLALEVSQEKRYQTEKQESLLNE